MHTFRLWTDTQIRHLGVSLHYAMRSVCLLQTQCKTRGMTTIFRPMKGIPFLIQNYIEIKFGHRNLSVVIRRYLLYSKNNATEKNIPIDILKVMLLLQ